MSEFFFQSDHPTALRRRQYLQSTKKKGCPAKIIMKEVVLFPEYMVFIGINTKVNKRLELIN